MCVAEVGTRREIAASPRRVWPLDGIKLRGRVGVECSDVSRDAVLCPGRIRQGKPSTVRQMRLHKEALLLASTVFIDFLLQVQNCGTIASSRWTLQNAATMPIA